MSDYLDPGSRARVEHFMQGGLRVIMAGVHAQCLERGGALEGLPDYVSGANLAGFQNVADSLLV